MCFNCFFCPRILPAHDPLQDPDWALEWRCLQLLGQHSQQSADALLAAAGRDMLPPWLRDACCNVSAVRVPQGVHVAAL